MMHLVRMALRGRGGRLGRSSGVSHLNKILRITRMLARVLRQIR